MSDEDWLRQFSRHHMRRKTYGRLLLVAGVPIAIAYGVFAFSIIHPQLIRPLPGGRQPPLETEEFWQGFIVGFIISLPLYAALFLIYASIALVIDRKWRLLLERAYREDTASCVTASDTPLLAFAERWLARRRAVVAGLVVSAVLLAVQSIRTTWSCVTTPAKTASPFYALSIDWEFGVLLGGGMAFPIVAIVACTTCGLVLLYRRDRAAELLLRLRGRL
jgi:hypothetical protein